MTKRMIPDKPKCLDSAELHQLRVASLNDELRKLQVACLEKDAELARTQAEVLRQKADVMRHRLLIMKQEHEVTVSAHVSWFSGIKTKYLADNEVFSGYNPETGAILITPKEQ